MNCIAVKEPKKNTVGMANACTASHLTVMIGYEIGRFFGVSPEDEPLTILCSIDYLLMGATQIDQIPSPVL